MPQLLKNVEQNWQIIDEAETHIVAEDDWQAGGQPLRSALKANLIANGSDASAIAVGFRPSRMVADCR